MFDLGAWLSKVRPDSEATGSKPTRDVVNGRRPAENNTGVPFQSIPTKNEATGTLLSRKRRWQRPALVLPLYL